jgi:hypothetical protein
MMAVPTMMVSAVAVIASGPDWACERQCRGDDDALE